MKRADLEKQLAKRIAGRMQQETHSDRYGTASGEVADKREQREREKAAGLVPFAVKLPQELVTKLQALAVERNATMNDLAAELLGDAFADAPAAKAEPARKAKPEAKAKPATKPKPEPKPAANKTARKRT